MKKPLAAWWSAPLFRVLLVFVLVARGWGQDAEEPQLPPPDADVAAGWDAFNGENYAEALGFWKRAAGRGVGAAYEGLGLAHWAGHGVPRNVAEARRLLEAGAKKGDPYSMVRLAGYLLDESNDPKTARDWLNRAASLSPMDSDVFQRASSILQNLASDEAQRQTEVEEAARRDALARTATAGPAATAPAAPKPSAPKPSDQVIAAKLDEFQRGEAAEKEKNYVDARRWYEKAAAAGSADGLIALARFHQFGRTVARDEKKAIELYDRAAAQGNAFAKMEADMLRSGSALRNLASSQKKMRNLAATIDGQPVPQESDAAKALPTQQEIDDLIRRASWSVADLKAALARGAKHQALAVALRTDGFERISRRDYQQLVESPEMRGYDGYGELNLVLLDHQIAGAGEPTRQVARAAIAARRTAITSLLKPVDTPELRTRALAGDAVALYSVLNTPDAQRSSALPESLQLLPAVLAKRMQAASYAPGLRYAADALFYGYEGGKDVPQAAALYRRAAEAGDPEAAGKLASAFAIGGDLSGVSKNYFETERWLLEAAARAFAPDDSVHSAEHRLYLLYSGLSPIGDKGSSLYGAEGLRWIRELRRRGGVLAENAELALADLKRNHPRMAEELATLPAEIPAWPADEVARVESAVRAGDVAAMLRLAEALSRGAGVPQDNFRAAELYRQAAGKGSAPAARALSALHRDGIGATKDPAQQIAWLRRAVECGDATAWSELAPLLGGDESRAAWENAAKAGDARAWAVIADTYRYGPVKDDAQYVAYLEKAAAAGHVRALSKLGEWFVTKKDFPRAIAAYERAVAAGEKANRTPLAQALSRAGRREEAQRLFRALAEEGDTLGQAMTAAYLDEDGKPAEALVWHRKLAAGSDATWKESSAAWVRDYEDEEKAQPGSIPHLRRQARGKGAEATAAKFQLARRLAGTNREAAASWIRAAADEGHALATAVYVPELARTNREGALQWVKAAAARGNAQAQLILALEGAATDKAAALAEVQRLATAGNLEAKLRVGMMKFQGAELPQDTAGGLAMITEAADGGWPAAQAELGRALMTGVAGIAADAARGLKYLKDAAAQDVGPAHALLGEIYERGWGAVPTDYARALHHYREAGRLGVPNTGAAIDRVTLLRSGKGPAPGGPAGKTAPGVNKYPEKR